MFKEKIALELHQKIVSDLQAGHQAHIASLSSQIEDLRKLIYSPTSATHIPLVSMEADAILSQHGEQLPLTDSEQAQFDADEADRILSGNY